MANGNICLYDVKPFMRNIDFVSYWSDGAAQFFKNRFIISYFTIQISEQLQNGIIKSQEAYYGKGQLDGVSATMKQIVWNTVVRKQTTVCSAKDFYDIVSVASHTITKPMSQLLK